MRRVLLILGITFAAGVYLTAAPSGATSEAPATVTATSEDVVHKLFVCKYVGTPGVDERLQTGQNPISVDFHSLDGPVPAVGTFFNDGQNRSFALALNTGQPEPDVSECPDVTPPTTQPVTTTTAPTTTTEGTTTTTEGTTTTPSTTVPTGGQFSITPVVAECVEDEPLIDITFGNRPDLNGQTGTLSFSPVGDDLPLTFISNATVQVPYPATTEDVTLTYTLGDETAEATVSFPEDCSLVTTTTAPGETTTTAANGVTTTAPPAGPTPEQPFAPSASNGTLPFTGMNTLGWVLIGIAAIGFGSVLGVMGRRRQQMVG